MSLCDSKWNNCNHLSTLPHHTTSQIIGVKYHTGQDNDLYLQKLYWTYACMFIVLLGNWEMKTFHYVTKLVNSPNADNIVGALMEAFTEDAVPRSNVLCFCSDGANAMRGRNNSVPTRVLQKQPSTYAMYCPCHVLALCASKAASSFDDELQPLLVQLVAFRTLVTPYGKHRSSQLLLLLPYMYWHGTAAKL